MPIVEEPHAVHPLDHDHDCGNAKQPFDESEQVPERGGRCLARGEKQLQVLSPGEELR